MITYEQPLNERVRLFLRLENLFHRFDYYMTDPSKESTQTALELLLELHEMSSRLDVKSAILKVIDHQTSVIRNGGAEDVDLAAGQDEVLESLEEKTRELYSYHGQLGQHMKNNGFLNLIKQRMTISGGVNGFDAPIFHQWINQPAETRSENLLEWIEPYYKSREAIDIVMELIRKSSGTDELVAGDGFYQSTVSGSGRKVFQLLRVHLAKSAPFYPEISAGKQRFSIRFVSAETLEVRGKQVLEDVPFSLSMCGF